VKYWVRHTIGSFAGFRADLRTLLAREKVPPRIARDLVMATQEAANNALQHGGAADDLEVVVTVFSGRIMIEVADRGPGFDLAAVRASWPPDVLQGRGRGLFLIDQLTDSLEVVPRRPGALVRMVKEF
jgi:anti-sigma regulatory factor (Ser/Thr protein kinase)